MYVISMPKIPLTLLDNNRVSKLQNRKSLFLDTCVWIDLIEGIKPYSAEARALLQKLVSQKILFCPLSLTLMMELFSQEYDSALRQAELMEELSLNVSFRIKEEIGGEEVQALIAALLTTNVDISPVSLDYSNIYVPVSGYMGAHMFLEYPEGVETHDLAKVVEGLQEKIMKQSVIEIVHSMKDELPSRSLSDNFDAEVFSEILKERRIASNGSRKKAREIEKHSLFEQTLVPLVFKITRHMPPTQRLQALKVVHDYAESLGGNANEVIMAKLPLLRQSVEVLTATGLDHRRSHSPNYTVDTENMIIPAIYADALVAPDKWVRAMMSDKAVRETTHAIFLSSFPELIAYCKSL